MLTLNRQQKRQAAKSKRSVGQYKGDPSAIYRVMNKLQPFTPAEQVSLAVPPRVCFQAMRMGQGTEIDFHTLAAVVNVALIMSEKISPLCVAMCQQAQAALMRVLARYTTHHKWGFDGLALQEIEPALDLHEQLLELCTPHQLQEAMARVIERMRNGDVFTEETA